MKDKLVSPVFLGAILVAVLGLGSAGTAEQPLPAPGAPGAEAAWVRTLSVEKSDHATTVWVHASGPLRYQTQMLSNPTRLVVDLPQAILLGRPRHIPVDVAAVLRVRTAQFRATPPVTRVVVDLREPLAYEIEAVPRGLKLTLLHTALDAPAVAAESQPAETPVLLASLAPVIPARAAAQLPEAPPPPAPA
ncbi:MAG: AMIN domain-containing protein, partial [Terriglobia bacterium]